MTAPLLKIQNPANENHSTDITEFDETNAIDDLKFLAPLELSCYCIDST